MVTEFSTFRIEFKQKGYSARSSWWQNETGQSPSTDSVDLNCDGNGLCKNLLDKGKFRLAIDLVLETDISSMEFIIKKSRDWLCSSFIIDYVRVFDVGNSGFSDEFNGNTTDKRASHICQVVYNELDRTKTKSQIDISTIIIISVAIFLLISLVSLITMLVLVTKKRKSETEQDKFDEIYSLFC